MSIKIISWSLVNIDIGRSNEEVIPIGDALHDTVLNVRDENNELVTEGQGHLFIAGMS